MFTASPETLANIYNELGLKRLLNNASVSEVAAKFSIPVAVRSF